MKLLYYGKKYIEYPGLNDIFKKRNLTLCNRKNKRINKKKKKLYIYIYIILFYFNI
jgi:hypothetical protein